MATLEPGGRISDQVVKDEIYRLKNRWADLSKTPDYSILMDVLGETKVAQIDRLEKVQLADVLTVCRESSSLAQTGRVLFAAFRAKKGRANDSDRLRKYLAKYGVAWREISYKTLFRLILDPQMKLVQLSQVFKKIKQSILSNTYTINRIISDNY